MSDAGASSAPGCVTERRLELFEQTGGEAAHRLRELSHDMRQPLAAIGALAEAAAGAVTSEPSTSDTVLCCLDRISEETQQLLQLCRHVLDQLTTRELVPVHVVARQIVDRIRCTAPCPIRLEATPCVIHADPIELRRVLANLVENAVRAAGATGVVDVAVRSDGERVSIEVGDSGPGFGLGPTGTAGIGFVLLQRFAAQHDGLVETGSSVRGGARVTCVLPAHGPAVRRRRPGRTPALPVTHVAGAVPWPLS